MQVCCASAACCTTSPFLSAFPVSFRHKHKVRVAGQLVHGEAQSCSSVPRSILFSLNTVGMFCGNCLGLVFCLRAHASRSTSL